MDKNYNQKERTVVTVIYQNRPYVFGSLACIFEYFSEDELGIKYTVLRTKMGKKRHVYRNNMCYIERSKLITKKMCNPVIDAEELDMVG